MSAAGRLRTVARAPPPRRAPPVRRPAAPVTLLQPVLRVGAVHDPAEREAETMAARVGAGGAPAAGAVANGARSAAAGPMPRSVESQPNLDELTEPPLPAAQADVEVAPAEDVPIDAITPTDTAELDGGEPVDTGGEEPAPDLPPIEDAPPPLPRAASDGPAAVVGREGGPAPADVAARVAHPGAGSPLPGGLAARVGPHFGRDFAEVRVHAEPADRAAAVRIGARAFTHGAHVWLGPGESPHDLRLMAHELTHVDQQTEAPAQAAEASSAPTLRRLSVTEEVEGVLRHVPGYTLATVILGRTVLSGARVAMTPENLVGGLMGLAPGGTAIFDKLREAQAVQEAFDWVRGKLDELNLTWSRASAVLARAPDAILSFSPIDNLTALFRPIHDDLKHFARAIAVKVLEFVVRGALRLAGRHADRVWEIIAQAREALGLILENPLGFAQNLIRSIVGGFQRFGANILDHLKRGLLGWLFGALSSAGITMPERLDFRGLLSLMLQILGLTYQAFRARLVRALGPSGERKVAILERSVEVVRLLVTEGFLGIWQRLVGMIENFRQTLIGGMQELVIGTVIRVGIQWLAGLSNPVGAVVRVVKSIYDMIVAFLERLDQIMQVAQSIFTSIGAIARGQVAQAIGFVEQTIGRTVPVVITFLAALLGLGDLPRRIQDVLRRIRRPIESALDRLIQFFLRHAKRLLARLIGRINGLRRLPSYNFRVGRTQHRLFLKRIGRGVEVYVNPAPERRLRQAEAANERELPRITNDRARAEAAELNQVAETTDRSTGRAAAIVDLASQTQNQLAYVSRLDEALRANAHELAVEGPNIDSFPEMSSQTNEGLFRAAEPRDAEFEGDTGAYVDLQRGAAVNYPANGGTPRSRYYRLDHTIEKRFPKAILENLHLIDPARAAARAAEPVLRADTRPERARARGRGAGAATQTDAAARAFGRIGADIQAIDEAGARFPAIAVYHRNHLQAKGRGLPSHEQVIAEARQQPNPHAHLRRLIARQFDVEIREMTAALDDDPSVTPAIGTRMRDGLAALRSLNDDFYGPPGRDPPLPAPPPEPAAPGGSTFAFQGGAGMPDFLAEEGASGAHGSLPGRRDFFQRDHVVDQAYPQLVKERPILGPETEARVAGRAGSSLDEAQRARTATLAREPIFPAGHPVRAYTEARGFAVALYRPLAVEVTTRTGRPPSAAALAEPSDPALGGMADYVRAGDPARLAAARGSLQASIRERFLARTEAHAGHAADAYADEIAKVVDANTEPNRQAARANMTQIGARVRASLVASRAATDSLFPR